MSFLAWIDFDQNDRDRARQIMDLFGEEDSRDELGLGSIRDGLADLMFPGTSTIQTRLRYMLFVPWIYREVMRHGTTADQMAQLARDREIALIEALVREESKDVIGSEARAGLKRLPSDIYWAGLGRLGIRRFQGSRRDYLGRSGAQDTANQWAAGLPPPPDDLFEQASFQLTPPEADFLIDRMRLDCADALLTKLAQSLAPACDMVWQYPDQSGWSDQHKAIVAHAEIFSDLMHGAALLYNLSLAELAAQNQQEQMSHWQELVETYRQKLADWRGKTDLAGLAQWHPDQLWTIFDIAQIKTPALTRRFTENWHRAVLASDGAVQDDHAARQLIEQRETRLKRGKSRFRNDAALARWGGASGTGRLNYRWPVVRRHLKDLADAV
jgi:Family of unknown function (DUF6361)